MSMRNLSFILILLACPAVGQVVQKKVLTEADYGKFGTLSVKEMATDGKWVSYIMAYENHADTLFIQNTHSKVQAAIPNGKNPRFGGVTCIAFKDNNDVILRQLQDGTSVRIKEVRSFQFLSKGRYLMTVENDSILQIRNNKGKVVESITGVNEVMPNESNDAVVYSASRHGKYEVGYINFKTNKKTILTAGTKPFIRLTWHAGNKAVVYQAGADLVYHQVQSDKKYVLQSEVLLAKGKIISSGSFSPIVLSNDGKKVFFSVIDTIGTKTNTLPENVGIWNGNDTCLYPVQKNMSTVNLPLLCVWFPDEGLFKILNDESNYAARLSGLNDYVVLSDPYRYGLEPVYYEYVDYYIKNVRTGTEQLFMELQSHDPNQLCFSPISNLMAYYKDKQWWLYNPDNETTVCLTRTIQTIWDNTSTDVPHQFAVYGVAGWSNDGKYVLVNDKWDVWKIALDGTLHQRISKGKEEQTVCRINKIEQAKVKNPGYQKDFRFVIDLKKDILVEAENQEDYSTGYYVYNSREGLRTLDYGPFYLSAIQRSGAGHYVYKCETFAQSPELRVVSLSNPQPKTVFKSNQLQENFAARKAELISYKNSKGTLLKAALFFPDGYDSTKQYPMIVSIYDKKSQEIYRYELLTLLNGIGYSIPNFTSRGYFVLYPDIEYELGNPGISAVDCVVAAVTAALKNKSINPAKIGLLGHSFGGYETNFIITQTNMFAAAISGAGVCDPIGRYFGLGQDSIHKDEMWRFESQQWRMGSSFFSNKEGYWRNSALVNADKISTPLLLWSGEDDNTVPFNQSVSFYMALRRLSSKAVLVSYPKEGHTLKTPINQKDLSQRTMQWFDYFLKGNETAGWITKGISTFD